MSEKRLQYCYDFHGMLLHSDLLLRAFPVAQERGERQHLYLQRGAPPQSLPSAVYANPLLQIGPELDLLLVVPSVGSFYTADKQHVIYSPANAIPRTALAAVFYTMVVPLLLHHLQKTPLRATVVTTEKGAIAFLGGAAAGKSSMGAALVERGRGKLLAEDVALLEMVQDGLHATAGSCHFHLWPDSVQALHVPEARVHPLRTGVHTLAVSAPAERLPQRLLAAVWVNIGPVNGPVALEPGKAMAWFQPEIFFHSHAISRVFGEQQREFLLLSNLAATVPLYSLTRPLDTFQPLSACLDEALHRIESVL